VYIGDVSGFGLLSYNMRTKKSWRIENKLFFPNPTRGTFYIAGETFEMMDGVTGLALTPQFHEHSERSSRAIGSAHYEFQGSSLFNLTHKPNVRFLYFHSLSSTTENIVPLQLLEDSDYWEGNPNGSPSLFRTIGSRGQPRYVINAWA
jgi:hypothetical protein